MTAEVRLHIRRKRDLIARARMCQRHVEYCSDCGAPYDRTGIRPRSTCGPCTGYNRNRPL